MVRVTRNAVAAAAAIWWFAACNGGPDESVSGVQDAGGDAAGDTTPGPDADAACTEAPPTSCSAAATCEALECGKPHSLLGSDGCVRAACAKDDDCAADERCLPSIVVRLGCQGSVLESCKPESGIGCSCGFTADCAGFVRCVPQAVAPESADCAFAAAATNCALLTEQASSIQTVLNAVTGTSTQGALQGCLAKVQARLAALGC